MRRFDVGELEVRVQGLCAVPWHESPGVGHLHFDNNRSDRIRTAATLAGGSGQGHDGKRALRLPKDRVRVVGADVRQRADLL